MGIHHHKSLLIFGTQAALLTGGEPNNPILPATESTILLQFATFATLQCCSSLLRQCQRYTNQVLAGWMSAGVVV